MGKQDAAPPFGEIPLMNGLDLHEVVLERALGDSGSIGMRPFAPLLSRINISFGEPSTSCTGGSGTPSTEAPRRTLVAGQIREDGVHFLSSQVMVTGSCLWFSGTMTSPKSSRSPMSRPITCR